MRNSSVKEAIGALENLERKPPEPVIVAGRIVGILDDGFVLQDASGRIDVVYADAVNVGDIVEVRLASRLQPLALPQFKGAAAGKIEGVVFCADLVEVLVKCAEEFFIRQSDPNYRKMIVDTAFREKFVKRQMLTQKIRDFFAGRGFTEAETPLMVGLPGMEPHLDPFKTEFRSMPDGSDESQKKDMYLITSPEYALKKLLVGGFEKVFQLSHSFRNRETESELHNPEFTMLEWYRAYADYRDIMKDTEELALFLAQVACGGNEVVFRDYRIDMSPPWERVSVKDLFERYAGIGEETLLDSEKLRAEARKRGYAIAEAAPYEDSFFIIFMNEIEPKLGIIKPVIVFDYPVQMAALARKSVTDPRYAERFEAYAGGMELCNAYSELNDPVEQEQRLLRENVQRAAMGKDKYEVDQSFIDALKFGMPPSAGNALGVDRLLMLMTNTTDIRDMILFPLRDL
jgi:EF-P lysine aminoacylase GenX